MKIGITGDTNWESKVDKILDELDNHKFIEYFMSKKYGNNNLSIVMGLFCHRLNIGFKQRVRHYKADNELIYDVMLDLDKMKISSDGERKKIVAEEIIKSVSIIEKYKFKDFDVKLFKFDLEFYFKHIKWI